MCADPWSRTTGRSFWSILVLKPKKVSWAQNCGEEVVDENCEMKKFEVSYNARNVAIKEAYFGNKVIIKNPNPGAKENAASMARNQELEQQNLVNIYLNI